MVAPTMTAEKALSTPQKMRKSQAWNMYQKEIRQGSDNVRGSKVDIAASWKVLRGTPEEQQKYADRADVDTVQRHCWRSKSSQ